MSSSTDHRAPVGRAARDSAFSASRVRRALQLAMLLPILGASGACAQSPSPPPPVSAAGPTARYGDSSHPNISGLWAADMVGRFVDFGKTPLPLTPAYAAKLEEARRMIETGTPLSDSVSRCIAFGVPRFMVLEFEVLQTPGQVTMITYVFHDVRRIYTDGTGHTPDVDPSYNGDSIGRWEGDTLVVDTTALRAGNVDQFGIYYSDKLTVVERIRLVGPDKMEIQFTLTDPEAFTRPWVVTRTYTRRPPGYRYDEYVCENNRNDTGGDVQQ